MLAADNPSTIGIDIITTQRQGVAFGILLSKVQLNKTVASRMNASDSFALSVTSADGTELSSADTGTTASATTGEVATIGATTADPFTLSESASSGSLNTYKQSWACTGNGAGDPALPSGAAGTSAQVTLGIGDLVNCTITNTALQGRLSLQKIAGPVTDVNRNGLRDTGDTIPYTFLVTNTGEITMNSVAVSDPSIGAVTCPAAGDTITYSFAVTNTGTSTVSGISIAEGAFSGTGPAPAVTCPAGATALAPGATVTCTGTYTVTQADADADAGKIDNSTTADGTTPSGAAVTSNESANVVPVIASPAVTLQKTASVSNVTAAGQTVTYTFLVTNTGNVTLLLSSDIIETRFTGHTVLRPVCPPGITSLAPGESISCTADYTVTQAEMDAGTIHNAATVSGQTPTGDRITTPESSIDITAQPSPAMTVEKSVTPTSITAAGQPVTYSYLITNTGNVTLTDVTAVEGAFTGTGPAPAVSCPLAAASLAPAATVTCTATYIATQEDIDTKYVTNTATAHGTPPGGGTPVDSEPSTTTFSVIASPELTIVKSSSPSTITRSDEVITYSFVATNTGNLTMTNVDVNEGTFTGTGVAPVVDCPAGPIQLAPNASVTCTATYTATQADVDSGKVDNTATAVGATLTSPDIPLEFGPAENSVGAPPQPELTIVKSATPSDRASFVTGAKITYTFVVTNTGNVTMDDVQVTDSAFTGSGPAPTADCSGGPTTLAPGEQLTCTANYTVTQADADAGEISNTATASGVPPAGGDPIQSEPSTVVLPHDSAPALELVKTATVSGSSIDYRFAVTNTGNVPCAM